MGNKNSNNKSEVRTMSASNGKESSEMIINIGDIDADYNWNARSAKFLTE